MPERAASLRLTPLGEPLTGHTGRVEWGAWNQVVGRAVLATGGSDRTVRLWDAENHTPLGEPLTGHTRGTRWGAWGLVAGRAVLATGSDDGTIRLWDAETRTQLGEPLTGRTGTVWWGAWGQVAGQAVLATDGDGSVRLWDAETYGWRGESLTGSAGWAEWGRVAGRAVLATDGDYGTVRLWDVETYTHRGELTGHTAPVKWGAWGRIAGAAVLATGGSDGMVRLWDAETSTPLGEPLTGHTAPIKWGAWGRVAGGAVLATGSDDGTVRLWDAETQTPLGEPLGHAGPVWWGAWARVAGRAVLATDGGSGAVRLWDAETQTPLGEPVTGHTDLVVWCAWGLVAGQAVLATGGDDATVRLWELIDDHPIPRLPTYRSDVSGAGDQLTRIGDAAALAELITARSARPPLAVGLFGDWGEGKSHFLDLVRRQVGIAAGPSNPLAHNAVRQVWFNAWHYAETDLWASLVAELFSQLAKPPSDERDEGAEQRRQSRLAAELVAQRGLHQRLAAARARRDDLQQALRRAEREDLGSWDLLSHEQREQLQNIAGPRPEQLYRSAVRTGATVGETGRQAWRWLRTLRPRSIAVVAVLLLALIAGAIAIAWVAPLVTRWWVAGGAGLTLVASSVAILRLRATDLAARTGPAWQTAQRIARAVVQSSQSQRDRLHTAVDVAAAEVSALEHEMRDLTAAGQLAGLVTERAASTDYRTRLGVMTQIREDFQRMATLLAHIDEQSTMDTDAAGDHLPRIDRIVVYIDDLDRCPPQRVVQMLEAIHLLLAVELFVVVVAVDPRWLLRAITAHYRDLLDTPVVNTDGGELVDPDDEELWRSTPAQYLEKIFQVVLTLPPLDSGGYQRLLRTLVGIRSDQPATDTPPTPPPGPTTQPESITNPAPDPGSDEDDLEADMFGVELPAARVVDRVDPLTLEPDELALLDLLGPPHLVSTPRAVKRLANSYGLLTAMRRDHRDSDLAEHTATIADPPHDVTYRPYRAGLVLLGALVAFPALGPALLLHLHHTAAEQPHHTWTTFLRDLQPRVGPGGWANPADPRMTPVQSQQWHALLDGLHHVTARATAHHLPLPEPLPAWADWVVPVGRLSFPAGRIVNTLDRQRPLRKP